MLTSAPFDNWWHARMDWMSKSSPPHVLLILGNLAVNTGTLILSQMNRATDRLKGQFDLLFLYIGAMIVALIACS